MIHYFHIANANFLFKTIKFRELSIFFLPEIVRYMIKKILNFLHVSFKNYKILILNNLNYQFMKKILKFKKTTRLYIKASRKALDVWRE